VQGIGTAEPAGQYYPEVQEVPTSVYKIPDGTVQAEGFEQ